jgi:hypothetical protein
MRINGAEVEPLNLTSPEQAPVREIGHGGSDLLLLAWQDRRAFRGELIFG